MLSFSPLYLNFDYKTIKYCDGHERLITIKVDCKARINEDEQNSPLSR